MFNVHTPLVLMSVFHSIVGRKTEMKGERAGKRDSCLYSIMTSLMHVEIQQFLFYSVRAFLIPHMEVRSFGKYSTDLQQVHTSKHVHIL